MPARPQRTSTRLEAAILLISVLVAFGLRTIPTFRAVFNGKYVSFVGHDAWYHVRLIENLVRHWPQRVLFDPYALHPGGQTIAVAPLFDLLAGGLALVAGAGSPSHSLVHSVCAFLPPIMGAVQVVLVFFIGRAVFGSWTGIIAASLFAVMPGAVLKRSMLGYADHHAAEMLFSTATLLFVVLAVRAAADPAVTLPALRRCERAAIRTVLYAVLAGGFLGCYLLSWVGGSGLVFLICAWLFLQCCVDHVRRQRVDRLVMAGLPAAGVGLVMVWPYYGRVPMFEHHVRALVVLAVTIVTLFAYSRLLVRLRIRALYYPLHLVVLCCAAFLITRRLAPHVVNPVLTMFSRMAGSGASQSVVEVRPLLSFTGEWSLAPAWQDFGPTIFIFVPAVVALAWRALREGFADKLLLATWGLAMLVATCAQGRFAYYLGTLVALLTAWACWRIANVQIRDRLAPRPRGAKRRGKREALPAPAPPASSAWRTAMAILIAGLVYLPSVVLAVQQSAVSGTMHPDWHEALTWLRTHTPPPFGREEYYYETYDSNSADQSGAAYGVLSWWDYGYWIITAGRRVPCTNPTQARARSAGRFFIAQDEQDANRMLQDMKARYVIVDAAMPKLQQAETGIVAGKFDGMALWAGHKPEEYFEAYYQRAPGGVLNRVMIYYPQYYRSMCVRLMIFGGRAVEPRNSSAVIAYLERVDDSGWAYKEITSAVPFATYKEALAFMAENPGANHRLVGTLHNASCVPLEPLHDYEQVHQVPDPSAVDAAQSMPRVRIFEYTGELQTDDVEP